MSRQVFCQFAALIIELFLLQLIDQIQHIVESGFPAVSDVLSGDRNGQMRLAGSGTPNHDDVGVIDKKIAIIEVSHLHLVNRRDREVKPVKILVYRELCQAHTVTDASDLPLRQLCFKKITQNLIRCCPALYTCRQYLIKSCFYAIQSKRSDCLHQAVTHYHMHLQKEDGHSGDNPPLGSASEAAVVPMAGAIP